MPIMAELRVERVQPQVIVIVGTGEVFDLTDWIENGMHWVLVRVGSKSLQSPDGRALEVTPENLDPLYDLLHAPSGAISPFHSSMLSGFVKHQWALDRVGYPLVFAPLLDAYVHLFPVAKPQFEHFLAEAGLRSRGDVWYAELLKLNPRLSPTATSFAEYEQLFITGLIPDDVQAYLHWHRHSYSLLTVENWRGAFRWMEAQDISVLPAGLERDLAPTARRLWDGLLQELHPRTLLDLSLMRNGVIEWVSGQSGTWLGMGQPRNHFYPNFHDPLHDDPFKPSPSTPRNRLFGFRLMRSV